MAKLKDVVAVTGKYEKNGETKSKYTNCGALIESNGKQFLVLEVIPAPVVGKDGIPKWLLNLYDPNDNRQKPEPENPDKPKPAGGGAPMDDDIPFNVFEKGSVV